MKKNFIKLYSLLILSLMISITCLNSVYAQQTTKSEINDIDKGIANLDYLKYEILANKGDKIENLIPKQGYNKDGKFIVLEHNKKSFSADPVDISVIDSIKDRTYPGALLLADEEFIKNRPSSLLVERNPIEISIDLPGSNSTTTKLVENPTYANINGAIDSMIDEWNEKNGDTHTLPARTQYNETMVHSKTQMKMGLNIDINTADLLLGVDFKAIENGEEKVMVASYKQIFYTVSAKLPNNPSDLFENNVTFKDLERQGVSNTAPPLLVNNVAYGRTIYVVLKTTSKSDNVDAAFKAIIDGQNIRGNVEYENILNNTSYSVVVVGGDSQTHNELITNNFDEVREVIKENSTFSLKNPAYPISYTSTFVKDNSLAAVHNTTEYVETVATEFNKGKVILANNGMFVGQFRVAWNEVSYDEKGEEVITPVEWNGNWKDTTMHYSSVLEIPANATNLRIYAQECTGLAWEWWRPVIDSYNVPISETVMVNMYGSSLVPGGFIFTKNNGSYKTIFNTDGRDLNNEIYESFAYGYNF